MTVIGRSIFAVMGSAIFFLAPVAGSMDLGQECMENCKEQKTSDDRNCPGPGQAMDQGRAECMKNNLEIFNGCAQNCSPGTPPAATAPQKTVPQSATPQTGTPQGTAPQSQTPQGSNTQNTTKPKELTQP
jgi:hypothetical protein